MIYTLYSIRDIKSGYLSPFVEVNDEVAIRGFQYSLLRQPDIVGFAPSDFQLFKLGSFDTASGEITANKPQYLASAADYINNKGKEVIK